MLTSLTEEWLCFIVLLKGGAKLEVVSKILGHSSVGITADIYRHIRTDEMHRAVQDFGPRLVGRKRGSRV